jgi:hypothetical protein
MGSERGAPQAPRREARRARAQAQLSAPRAAGGEGACPRRWRRGFQLRAVLRMVIACVIAAGSPGAVRTSILAGHRHWGGVVRAVWGGARHGAACPGGPEGGRGKIGAERPQAGLEGEKGAAVGARAALGGWNSNPSMCIARGWGHGGGG